MISSVLRFIDLWRAEIYLYVLISDMEESGLGTHLELVKQGRV